MIEALQNVCFSQKPQMGLILHTDLGSQYNSSEFTRRVQKYEIKQSFSQKGCPCDNVCVESFHAILKKEEVYYEQYTDYQAAKRLCFNL